MGKDGLGTRGMTRADKDGRGKAAPKEPGIHAFLKSHLMMVCVGSAPFEEANRQR